MQKTSISPTTLLSHVYDVTIAHLFNSKTPMICYLKLMTSSGIGTKWIYVPRGGKGVWKYREFQNDWIDSKDMIDRFCIYVLADGAPLGSQTRPHRDSGLDGSLRHRRQPASGKSWQQPEPLLIHSHLHLCRGAFSYTHKHMYTQTHSQ